MSSHVDVTGTGSASGTPDILTLDVRVSCDGADVAGTLREASTRMADVQGAARGSGVAAADLQTTGSGVHQRWANDRPEVVGYTAWHTLRIRVRDIDRAGAVVTALSTAAGNALGIDNIALALRDPEPLMVQARERAFADARAKADQFAALADRPLGVVERVTDLPVGGPGGPAPRAVMMAASPLGPGMPVEAGEATVTVAVRVRWSWAD